MKMKYIIVSTIAICSSICLAKDLLLDSLIKEYNIEENTTQEKTTQEKKTTASLFGIRLYMSLDEFKKLLAEKKIFSHRPVAGGYETCSGKHITVILRRTYSSF